jgi:hypothetical protein
MTPSPTVFLVDVDNTLIDNDRIQNDLKRYLEREFGAACRDRYWAILEQLFTDLGYRDYLGALQRYRVEHPQDIHHETAAIGKSCLNELRQRANGILKEIIC